jgi:hypothetical protein
MIGSYDADDTTMVHPRGAHSLFINNMLHMAGGGKKKERSGGMLLPYGVKRWTSWWAGGRQTWDDLAQQTWTSARTDRGMTLVVGVRRVWRRRWRWRMRALISATRTASLCHLFTCPTTFCLCAHCCCYTRTSLSSYQRHIAPFIAHPLRQDKTLMWRQQQRTYIAAALRATS